jgi:hypothetical protein
LPIKQRIPVKNDFSQATPKSIKSTLGQTTISSSGRTLSRNASSRAFLIKSSSEMNILRRPTPKKNNDGLILAGEATVTAESIAQKQTKIMLEDPGYIKFIQVTRELQ